MTTDSNVLIKVQGLEKSFGDLHVLKGIDAEIRRGDVMVVVGASGSGKSTFLRCLNLLEQPTGGTITFEGVNITDPSVNINLHRQKMGMVFQQFNLFPHKTVLKNMTLGPIKLLHQSRAEAEKHALELLERVGLADKAYNSISEKTAVAEAAAVSFCREFFCQKIFYKIVFSSHCFYGIIDMKCFKIRKTVILIA